ncbi:hypothetical protein NDU88_000822 [Pleurodeles waltl]|uniref:Uncharacterized protein n=1 Tax=Pleurodeles waltl TaxID=8319 RepID=A0AAV7US88_PLEWA|nr:hypothetical protein NDU88_000822 [Pleurodeles waltl]
MAPHSMLSRSLCPAERIRCLSSPRVLRFRELLRGCLRRKLLPPKQRSGLARRALSSGAILFSGQTTPGSSFLMIRRWNDVV